MTMRMVSHTTHTPTRSSKLLAAVFVFTCCQVHASLKRLVLCETRDRAGYCIFYWPDLAYSIGPFTAIHAYVFVHIAANHLHGPAFLQGLENVFAAGDVHTAFRFDPDLCHETLAVNERGACVCVLPAGKTLRVTTRVSDWTWTPVSATRP